MLLKSKSFHNLYKQKTHSFAKLKDKNIIGLTEYITICGKKKQKKIKARIDTGATKSSIDLNLASKLHLGPIIRSRMVKSAHGNKIRPVIECEIKISMKRLKAEFTLAERTHMKYEALIGQNILKKGFLIDPSKE
ncbi:hypothetical protein GF323_05365 [Candidatus Woesearchaeota archaeon]|nr:hypothetical protein [Candidatus Woesearchaeota archaeon]